MPMLKGGCPGAHDEDARAGKGGPSPAGATDLVRLCGCRAGRYSHRATTWRKRPDWYSLRSAPAARALRSWFDKTSSGVVERTSHLSPVSSAACECLTRPQGRLERAGRARGQACCLGRADQQVEHVSLSSYLQGVGVQAPRRLCRAGEQRITGLRALLDPRINLSRVGLIRGMACCGAARGAGRRHARCLARVSRAAAALLRRRAARGQLRDPRRAASTALPVSDALHGGARAQMGPGL